MRSVNALEIHRNSGIDRITVEKNNPVSLGLLGEYKSRLFLRLPAGITRVRHAHIERGKIVILPH